MKCLFSFYENTFSVSSLREHLVQCKSSYKLFELVRICSYILNLKKVNFAVGYHHVFNCSSVKMWEIFFSLIML